MNGNTSLKCPTYFIDRKILAKREKSPLSCLLVLAQEWLSRPEMAEDFSLPSLKARSCHLVSGIQLFLDMVCGYCLCSYCLWHGSASMGIKTAAGVTTQAAISISLPWVLKSD